MPENRREAIKDAAGWGWVATTIVGAVAMSFGKGPAQEAGILILAINVLAPGRIIVKDIGEDIIKKWKKEK